ncbi:DUF2268 domain-containing protein [Bacillus sp. S/N-304-OC-R1]|nr:DUF2268 domain-containing protein [Bacillus sp. S/N-304-OC-R1]
MYKPNRQTYETFKALKEKKYWEKTEKIFRKYKKAWNGPDIDIYIFPIAARNTLFSRVNVNKSGVAFEGQLFLFITPSIDDKELEALFVHEYHHTCRLQKKNIKLEDATLLDSIILEGLAEHAVYECCGEKYTAEWCRYYSEKEIIHFWNTFLKSKLHTKKMSKEHDEILYGRGGYPKMTGYAAGFVIVSMYKEKNKFSLRDSFNLPSESFISSLSGEKRTGKSS